MKFTEIQTLTLDRDRRIELRVLRCFLSLIRAIYNYGSFPSLLPSISIRVLQFASDESLRDAPRKIPAGCDRTESSPSKLLIQYSRAGSTISPFESRWDRDYQRHDSRNELEKYNGLYLGIDRSNVSFFFSFRAPEIYNSACPLKYLLDREEGALKKKKYINR